MFLRSHPVVESIIQKSSRQIAPTLAGAAVVAAFVSIHSFSISSSLLADSYLQNVVYMKFFEPAFKLPSIAISHIFQIPLNRSKIGD